MKKIALLAKIAYLSTLTLTFLDLNLAAKSFDLPTEPSAETIIAQRDPIYSTLRQNFLSAANSSNLNQQLEYLTTEADRAEIKQAAEEAFKAQVATGKFKDQTTHETLKQKLLSEQQRAYIVKQIEHISLIYDQFALKQRFADDKVKRATFKEHSSRDLRAFVGKHNSTLKSLLSIIFNQNYICTISGKARAAYELANPCADTANIRQKQARIQWLIDNPEAFAKIDKILREIALVEKEWTGLWMREKVNHEKLMLGSFGERFKELEKFNITDWVPREILSPEEVMVAAQTYGISLLIRKINKQISKTDTGMQIKALLPFALAGLTAIYSLGLAGLTYLSFEKEVFEAAPALAGGAIIFAVTTALVLKTGSTKLKGVMNAQQTLCQIRQLKDGLDDLLEIVPKEVIPQMIALQSFIDGEDGKDMKAVLKKLDSATFAGSPSRFSHHGRTIRTFVILEGVKDRFAKAMEVIGLLDFYMAVAKIIKASADKQNGFCFAELVENEKPVFECQGMWDVFIDPAVAVANDLTLGKGTGSPVCGALVSGPNYGGKSVFLRGMITTALLAQSLGIAPAKTLKITPFHIFDTYVSVQDDPAAKESLFSAEMARVESMLDSVATASSEGKKVFIIGDELLTGTKPKYAQALVRAILQKLARSNNGVFIFSTHFDEVIKNTPLETSGAFSQLKVSSTVDKEGFYEAPTFKIEPGVSSVDSALFIAERKLPHHYDVVDCAKRILTTE